MKTINKILGFAAIMLLGLFAVSCTDGNDWEVDSSYSRLFAVDDDDITVTADTVQATVKFSSISGAEYYIIEVSTDSLYDAVEMGGPNAIVYGEDHSITSSPVVIDNLVGETSYYLRLKGVSSEVPESHWAYYKSGGTFKTLTEQLFNQVEDADITSTSVRVTWQPGAEVTRLGMKTALETDTTFINLDAATIAAGEYTFTGLNSTTTYTFFIFNGNVKRGSINVTTIAGMPDADFVYTLSEDATIIDQDLMDEIVAEAQAASNQTNVSITISLPSGKTIDLVKITSEGSYSSVSIPEGISVTFYGASANRPSLNLIKSLEIGGYHNLISFENVNLIDGGCQYIFNQSNACSIGELSFKSVNIDALDRSLVRLQTTSEQSIESIIVDDCMIANQGAGGYALIYYKDNNTTVGSIKVTNSTFNTLAHNFIQCPSPVTTNTIDIEACTFYNVIGSGRYLVDAQDSETEINLTNLILAKTYVESGSKGIRTAGTITCSNVLRTNDFVISSNDFKPDLDDTETSSTDLFADPTNGDFTVLISKYADLGDPRWFTDD